MVYMTIMTLVALVAFTTIICFLFIRLIYQTNEALAATNAMCETSEIFVEWMTRNPGVYIGLSDKGRLLLSLHIEAYDWFLETHKYIDGRERREYLISLLNELPPKDPDQMPVTKGRRKRRPLLLF